MIAGRIEQQTRWITYIYCVVGLNHKILDGMSPGFVEECKKEKRQIRVNVSVIINLWDQAFS